MIRFQNACFSVCLSWKMLLYYFLPSVGDGLVQPEALNKKAIQIINRVRDKLTGEQHSFTLWPQSTETWISKWQYTILAFIIKNQQVVKQIIMDLCEFTSSRTRLFPWWDFGRTNSSGAAHQTSYFAWKPVPVLHWMVCFILLLTICKKLHSFHLYAFFNSSECVILCCDMVLCVYSLFSLIFFRCPFW